MMGLLRIPFLPNRKQAINIPNLKKQGASRMKVLNDGRLKSWTGWWWEEITFLSLSWLLILGAVVLLRYEDHTSLSKWKFPLKPNSVLAILTTFIRASLLVPILSCVGQLKWLHFRHPNGLRYLDLFDGTSSGPWSSLVLLFRLRNWGKAARLAWAAALFSVLSLGIAPTAQQALTFGDEWTVRNSTDASVGVATGFATSLRPDIDPLSGLAQLNLASNSSQLNILPLHGETINAIYNKSSNINLNCPSNSCQWPDFVSLGVCSSCVNVSEKSTDRCWTFNCAANASTAPFPCNVASNIRNGTIPRLVTTCTVTTPNNATIDWSRISQSDPYCSTAPKSQRSRACAVLTKLNSTTSWEGKPYPRSINAFMIQPSPEILTLVGLRMKSETEREINQCSLSWCAHRYARPFHLGTLTSAEQTIPIPMIGKSLDGKDGIAFWNLTFFDDDTVKPRDPSEKPIYPKVDLYGNHTFQINAPAAWFLGNILTGVFTQQLGLLESPKSHVDLILATILYKPNTDWTSMMDRVASGLTVSLRNTPDTPLHFGQVLNSEVYTHVHWIWLLPTVILAVLTSFLLLFTILLTKRCGIPVWKALGLVYLFSGLEGWSREELQVQSLEDIQRKARNMSVQLMRYDDGDWRLVKS